MLEIGVSQAQMQFTKLLDKMAVIIDKKTKVKRAVILPYDEYQKLIKNQKNDDFSEQEGAFDNFVGVLNNNFKSEDEQYRKIVK